MAQIYITNHYNTYDIENENYPLVDINDYLGSITQTGQPSIPVTYTNEINYSAEIVEFNPPVESGKEWATLSTVHNGNSANPRFTQTLNMKPNVGIQGQINWGSQQLIFSDNCKDITAKGGMLTMETTNITSAILSLIQPINNQKLRTVRTLTSFIVPDDATINNRKSIYTNILSNMPDDLKQGPADDFENPLLEYTVSIASNVLNDSATHEVDYFNQKDNFGFSFELPNNEGHVEGDFTYIVSETGNNNVSNDIAGEVTEKQTVVKTDPIYYTLNASMKILTHTNHYTVSGTGNGIPVFSDASNSSTHYFTQDGDTPPNPEYTWTIIGNNGATLTSATDMNVSTDTLKCDFTVSNLQWKSTISEVAKNLIQSGTAPYTGSSTLRVNTAMKVRDKKYSYDLICESNYPGEFNTENSTFYQYVNADPDGDDYRTTVWTVNASKNGDDPEVEYDIEYGGEYNDSITISVDDVEGSAELTIGTLASSFTIPEDDVNKDYSIVSNTKTFGQYTIIAPTVGSMIFKVKATVTDNRGTSLSTDETSGFAIYQGSKKINVTNTYYSVVFSGDLASRWSYNTTGNKINVVAPETGITSSVAITYWGEINGVVSHTISRNATLKVAGDLPSVNPSIKYKLTFIFNEIADKILYISVYDGDKLTTKLKDITTSGDYYEGSAWCNLAWYVTWIDGYGTPTGEGLDYGTLTLMEDTEIDLNTLKNEITTIAHYIQFTWNEGVVCIDLHVDGAWIGQIGTNGGKRYITDGCTVTWQVMYAEGYSGGTNETGSYTMIANKTIHIEVPIPEVINEYTVRFIDNNGFIQSVNVMIYKSDGTKYKELTLTMPEDIATDAVGLACKVPEGYKIRYNSIVGYNDIIDTKLDGVGYPTGRFNEDIYINEDTDIIIHWGELYKVTFKFPSDGIDSVNIEIQYAQAMIIPPTGGPSVGTPVWMTIYETVIENGAYNYIYVPSGYRINYYVSDDDSGTISFMPEAPVVINEDTTVVIEYIKSDSELSPYVEFISFGSKPTVLMDEYVFDVSLDTTVNENYVDDDSTWGFPYDPNSITNPTGAQTWIYTIDSYYTDALGNITKVDFDVELYTRKITGGLTDWAKADSSWKYEDRSKSLLSAMGAIMFNSTEDNSWFGYPSKQRYETDTFGIIGGFTSTADIVTTTQYGIQHQFETSSETQVVQAMVKFTQQESGLEYKFLITHVYDSDSGESSSTIDTYVLTLESDSKSLSFASNINTSVNAQTISVTSTKNGTYEKPIVTLVSSTAGDTPEYFSVSVARAGSANVALIEVRPELQSTTGIYSNKYTIKNGDKSIVFSATNVVSDDSSSYHISVVNLENDSASTIQSCAVRVIKGNDHSTALNLTNATINITSNSTGINTSVERTILSVTTSASCKWVSGVTLPNASGGYSTYHTLNVGLSITVNGKEYTGILTFTYVSTSSVNGDINPGLQPSDKTIT